MSDVASRQGSGGLAGRSSSTRKSFSEQAKTALQSIPSLSDSVAFVSSSSCKLTHFNSTYI